MIARGKIVALKTDPELGVEPSKLKPTSPATRVRRFPRHARYDRDSLNQVLDEGLICHIGFVDAGRPFVIPTIHARVGDVIYIHGSPVGRMLKTLKDGVEVCLTVTILDGIVLARSAFFSNMNYRSVLVMGRAVEVTDPDEKRRSFEAIVEHMARGRWSDCRRPTAKEARSTSVVRLPIKEFSTKMRHRPAKDPVSDHDLPYWAGVVPIALASAAPEDTPDLKPGIKAPPYAVNYKR
jgi:nitroimidazol reductase NimA-like FMN-containing flavoprotein (pyridoxamine 5'-phosphate oxidase superfamily)